MKKVFGGSSLSRVMPNHSYSQDLDYLFASETYHKLPPVYVSQYTNCIYLRDTFYTTNPLKSNFKLTHHPADQPRSIARLKRRLLLFLPRKQALEGFYFIATDSWFRGYFHWLLDSLPRITAYQEFLSKESILLFPASARNISYIQESLALLGISYIIASQTSPQLINTVDLIDPITSTGNYNPLSLRLLKQRFNRSMNVILENSNKTESKQLDREIIYVSRAHSSRRHLINEIELIKTIESIFKMKIIYPENLNFIEQIQVFSKAYLLVGLHGAGLSNMLFMNQNSAVLEIRAKEDAHNNCFFSLASALQLEYGFVLAEKLSSEDSVQTTDLILNDFDVLIVEIKRLLKIIHDNDE